MLLREQDRRLRTGTVDGTERRAMSDDQWFMAIGGHQVGPASRDDVVTNLRNGTIDGNTLVFGPGLTNWTPLKDVP